MEARWNYNRGSWPDESDSVGIEDGEVVQLMDNVHDSEASVDSDASALGTEETIVPGTAYDVISATARREAIRRSIPPSSIEGIDNRYERWIRLVLWDEWGIHSPHEWQIHAIHDIAFSNDTSTFLIAKTGSGKSAVPLTVGSLLTGVTLTMVPLVGLGSDQVNKCSNDSNFIEGYHLDEHRGVDAQRLTKRLLSLTPTEAEYTSIFLYASPQSLQVGTQWYHTLMSLAANDLIRLIVVDEAHTVAQDGRDFRPEFTTAVTCLRSIHQKLRSPCNFVAMSATFRQSDQDEISRLWTRRPDKVIWRELSRRGIWFDIVISGRP